MTAKKGLSALKSILDGNKVWCYSCPIQPTSKSILFQDKLNQLRLISHLQCSTFAAIETDKLLCRPEIQNYLNLISDEYDRLNTKNKITPFIAICGEVKKYKKDLKNLETLNSENDKEMQKLIDAEKENYIREIRRLSSELIKYALPKDEDCKSVIFSVLPGLGGHEARLFSEELFDMYLSYADYKKWEILSVEKLADSSGGIHRAEASISGESVYSFLRHESGIHRVQRVPPTAKQNKMQTSTCKITVLPEFEANDIVLKDSDLKFETKTSSGPGGQNVNKVETCVRLTHIPTGHVVECQSERYQERNKTIALKKLRNLLYQEQQEEISSKLMEIKMDHPVAFKRSDKIRTYNFMQNRITDHRINYTTHNLEKYFEGEKLLDEMLTMVNTNYQTEYLIRNINRFVKLKNISELFEIEESR